MRLNSRFARLGLFLLALLPAACRLADDAPPGNIFLSIDADPSLLQRDTVIIILKASTGADTLFDGKLSSLDTLRRLPAGDYDGGRALIIIQGFQGGQLVYEERRDYNGATQKNLIVDVPLDLTSSGHRSSLDLRPDRVKLFLGGAAVPMQASPTETWKDKPLVWTTGDAAVATVSQTGEVTPVGLGVTYVRAVFGDTVSDASSITVVRDIPVLDFGSDTTLAVGASVSFHVKVTQEYGDVAEFAWDLDGDGAYEGTVAGVSGQTDFAVPARTYSQTGDFTVRVRVRDGEGNVAFAAKKVKINATAPKIDSLAASRPVISIKDAVSFKALASGGGAALKTFAWDFDGDGKDDQSGNLQGDTATVTGAFNYPDAKTYKATLRITDADGGSITASTQITVKLDRPTADAGVDVSVAGGAQVRLRGRGGDTLGSIVTQEWKIGSGNFAPASDSGTVTCTAPADPGTFPCVFRVTDDDGLSAEDTMLVTVNDGKAPTVASFLPQDTVVSIKDEVSFAAQAEAVDADLKSWALDVDGDGNPEAQGDLSGRSQAIRAKRIFPAPGIFDVSLKVADLNGKSTTAKARVTVLLDAPKADAGADTTVGPGARVNLHGRAKDSLGTIVRMEWKIGSGSFAPVSKGDTAITAPTTAGAFTCVFRAMDNDSLVDSDMVIVTVKAATNAALATLAITPSGLSPSFSPDVLAYTLAVSNSVSEVTLTPTVADAGSALKVNGSAAESGKPFGPVKLDVGATAINIAVTAQDGVTTKTYTVSVTRGASSNADLSNLALSAGVLTPGFVPATAAYTASVSNSTDSIKVTPTSAGTGSTIKVNSVTVASGNASKSIGLDVGPNTITIEVTAQDGTTKKTYTATVTRSASANADLSNLALTVGTLSPIFTPGTTNYTASVPNATDSIKVTPTAGTTGATIKVNTVVTATATASKSFGLNVGPNTITVEVTAPDGIAKNTYTVTVTRAPSANADLSNLALSGTSLSPVFAAGTTAYTASVPNAADSIKATPTVAGTGATVKVNGATVASGSASDSIGLAVGTNAITVVVTAQDGTTKKTYTVTVTRAPNANANLSNLTTTPGPISPVFAAGTLAYTLTVPYSTISVSVTATLAATTSTLKVKTAAATSGNAVSVNLAVGANSIPVDVTAQDGTTKKTYTLTVTRSAPSANANLSALAVPAGVTYSPTFDPTVTDYDATATTSVASLYLQPTAADANATITVDGAAVTSGNKSADLAFLYGTGSHTIVVTAQDGVTKKTYNFAIWRPGSADFITGYAWVNNFAVNGQVLTNVYNPAGTVNFARTAAGTYTVTFRGLATLGNSSGIVHATAYAGPAYCKVVSTSNSGGDLVANIACFGMGGNVVDSRFTILAQFPRSSDKGLNAYALADAPSTDSYSPSPARSYSSLGGGSPIVIARVGAGHYNVTFRGMDLGINESGNTLVTAYGSGNIRCEMQGWSIGGGDATADVYCLEPVTGDRKDAPFNISYAQVVSGTSSFGIGASVGNNGDGPFSFSTSNGSVTSEEISTGYFHFTFAGLGSQGGTRAGNVQLTTTAFGAPNNACTVEATNATPPDYQVWVMCWDNTGTSAWSAFSILVTK